MQCYHLLEEQGIDPMVIQLFVERARGHVSQRGDITYFWVPTAHSALMLCAWPELVHNPQMDLY